MPVDQEEDEIQLQFRRVRADEIYFNEHLDREFLRQPMPESIRKHRNVAIVLIGVQIVLAFMSLELYFRRRVRTHI